MERDNKLCAFVLVWNLLPRGSNHAQLTTKDICLIHALKGQIHTDWIEVISDNLIKTTRLPMDMSTTTPTVRPKNDFEKYVLKQLLTLVRNHYTYISRFEKLDKEIFSLQRKIGNWNLAEDGEVEDNEDEEEDDEGVKGEHEEEEDEEGIEGYEELE
ncbi:hypothetical protein V8G54_037331 [Vigna mungo]|uniref:Uncharacterized protein n=1 Tax=Vigna mungo TaxID=3915 RepID=A0AAQ3MIQ3_VIGMU